MQSNIKTRLLFIFKMVKLEIKKNREEKGENRFLNLVLLYNRQASLLSTFHTLFSNYNPNFPTRPFPRKFAVLIF